MNTRHPRLSIVIPVLDEAPRIRDCLEALAPLRRRAVEVVVADGGSRDDTVSLARPLADQVIIAPRGRGAQSHAGAQTARGENLMFLHADTRLPDNADRRVLGALSAHPWGRFDVDIEGSHRMLGVIAAMINLRSRLSGIATGDQAMFMRRSAYEAAGGFPDIALMEDLALSKALRRLGRPACLHERVATSGRRWEKHGVARTILLMWRLRAAYFLGADPERLARRYGYRPRGEH